MNLSGAMICEWPRVPALPPPGQAVLIRVGELSSRPTAREKLRAVLREVLSAWSGLAAEALPLRETARGPVWPELLAGHPLDLSLSYAGGEGWIGLLRGAAIGVDAQRVGAFAEMDDVAGNYLEPKTVAAIQQSADPQRAFALAWTELEARLKCLKRGLVECSSERAAALAECESRSFVVAEKLAVTVASARPDPGRPR
jgi:phosphopantetheinyl transferase